MAQHTAPSDTRTWPDLAAALYDRLTGRGAEITYEAEDVTIHVPSAADPAAAHAKWKIDGKLTIRTRDRNDA